MKTYNENNKQKDDDRKNHNSSAKRLVIGLLLVVVGLLWLGVILGYIPKAVKEYVISWQALLIFLGISGLFKSKKEKLFSLILIFVGTIFLIDKSNHLPVDVYLIAGPLVLVFVGFMVLFKFGRGLKWKAELRDYAEGADYVDDTNIFSGSKLTVVSQNFKGGRISNIFGGTEIDFTQAELQDGDTIVDIDCIFGGVKFLLPADWHVIIDVNTIFGDVSDKRQMVTSEYVDFSKRFIIRGNCVFGGGEIKSVLRRVK